MRLPFFSTYRSGYDSVELSDDADICIAVQVFGGARMVQSEAGDVVNLADPLVIPLEFLADYLNTARRRKKVVSNGTA